MTQICPCCKKELAPPPPPLSSSASTIEEDMGDLFSCKHCQSVLKWDKGGELKVIYESKEEVPSPSLEDPSSPLSSLSEKENLFSLEEQTPPPPPLSESEEIFLSEPKIEETTPPDPKAIKTEEGLSSLEVYKEPLQENLPEEKLSFPQKQESHQQDKQNTDEEKEKKTHEEKEAPDFSMEKTEKKEPQENYFEELPDESFNDEEVIQTDPSGQDFSDVEQYGNAQASSEKGFLRYDLRISGLDSSEIEKQVLYILENPRFKWDAGEVLRSQKEGVLTIKNLNPIKAMCLVSDLSFLSVELSWKQYMALNAEIQEESPEQTEES